MGLAVYAYDLGQYLFLICKLTFCSNLFIHERKQLPCRQDRNNKEILSVSRSKGYQQTHSHFLHTTSSFATGERENTALNVGHC